MNNIVKKSDALGVNQFTDAELDWVPWITPLTPEELTPQHYAGLVDRARAKSAYFLLLARDPDVLGARTRLDKDIFYSSGGLPRAERELAATAVSRLNGCIYCASVHARFFVQFSKKDKEIQNFLSHGRSSVLEPRNAAIAQTAFELTESPNRFDVKHVEALEAVGFSDEEILDLIQASSFFNWANRLMLSLGEAQKVVSE